MTLHNYATPLLTILLTRLSGGVDGRNLAMNGKAARQTVARGAAARVAGSASVARRGGADRVRCGYDGASCEQQAARSAQALAAGGKLGDEFLQKINSDFKAWHRDKLAHGVSVVSAGSNIGAW